MDTNNRTTYINYGIGFMNFIPKEKKFVKGSSGISFKNYLQSEFRRGYLLENDEERFTTRMEKVYTFLKIPRETEKFFAYGFFQCADSFSYVITFLPIRFCLALWSLLTFPFRWWFSLHGRDRKDSTILRSAEVIDLLKGVILVSCCYLISYIDTSVCYHIIKTQSTIKLYLFFNMLEIADKLMSAFGQDSLDTLFWAATQPHGRKREHLGIVFHLGFSVAYVALHSVVVLLQALTLNVAINSDNKGLMTILISNNFVELKGAVFKKFDKNNLLQISCSDVRERFHIFVLLFVVVIQTLKEYSWKEGGTEILIDWIKHAFITRFNDISSDVYRDYTTLLASDLIICKQKYAYSDHSDLVARRMGFIPIPLGVVMFRILSQCLSFPNKAAYLLTILGFLCIMSFRVLNGILILGKACDLMDEAEIIKSRCNSCSELNNSTQFGAKDASSLYGKSPARSSQKVGVSSDMPPKEVNKVEEAKYDSSLVDQELEFFGDSSRSLMRDSMVNLDTLGATDIFVSSGSSLSQECCQLESCKNIATTSTSSVITDVSHWNKSEAYNDKHQSEPKLNRVSENEPYNSKSSGRNTLILNRTLSDQSLTHRNKDATSNEDC